MYQTKFQTINIKTVVLKLGEDSKKWCLDIVDLALTWTSKG